MGVVFTVKHRSPRPLEKAPVPAATAVVQAAQPVVVNQPVAAKPKPPAPRVDAVAVPVVPVAAVTEPEKVAIPPRPVVDDPLIDKTSPEPTVGRAEKPTVEPTQDPKESQVPVAIADNIPPNNEAASKLAPTDVPRKAAQSQSFGTKIEFAADQAAAFDLAKKDKNTLVLVITYAGSFKEGSFTSETAEQFRKNCLMKENVAEFLKDNNFVCVMQCVSGLGKWKGMKAAGNVVSYFCRSDRAVLHAVGGPVDDVKFLEQARVGGGNCARRCSNIRMCNSMPTGSGRRTPSSTMWRWIKRPVHPNSPAILLVAPRRGLTTVPEGRPDLHNSDLAVVLARCRQRIGWCRPIAP